MNDDGTNSELLAALADEFAERLRRGERPTPEDYARRHPEVAQEIAELFPAIALMERAEPGTEASLVERAGSQIGDYKLLEQIGEGAFGVVFMAEQLRPVRRRVALKVLKPGMDTKQVVARFAAERQALARMDHPNIATVLDAGETDSGRPYFVMELVRGVALTDYCDANQLSPRERLALFVEVCRAVQHAHVKGIIHRDLKPSNVLVTQLDGAPSPKVIDFGVAKAIDAPLTERTLFTNFAQFVGTPLYMSPEQAEMSGQDVDTRSDIYSLGVLLYELLTGFTPFDRERFRTVGIDELRRIIREEEPPRPSDRISTLTAEMMSTVAGRRRIEPRRLVHTVRRDLDWIVTKCLEKDRNRRYATAHDLAADVQRYLDGEPVQARPPSQWYRFQKFAARHKAGVAAGMALAAAALLSVVGLVANNRLVTWERDQKDAALERVVEEKQRADENLARARGAVKEYLLQTSENPLLQQADFQELRKELLESAVPFYEEFVQQQQADPELEKERGLAYDDLAFLRQQMGDWDQALAEQQQAEAIFRGLADRFPDEPDYLQRLAETLNNAGNVLHSLGRFEPAERDHREAVSIATGLSNSYPKNPIYRDTEARSAGNLGVLLKDTGRYPEAESLLRRSVELRQALIVELPDKLELRGQVAQSWMNLGAVLMAERRTAESEDCLKAALEALDPETLQKLRDSPALPSQYQQTRAQILNNLAVVYNGTERFVEGEKASRESLAIKKSLADTFPSNPHFQQELARAHSNLGVLLSSLDKLDDAAKESEKSIEIYEKLVRDFGDQPEYSVELAGTCVNLARLWGDGGQLERSLPVLGRGIEILDGAMQQNATLPKVRNSLVIAHWTRAMTLCGLERYSEAIPDWTRAIELDDGQYGDEIRLKRASTHIDIHDHQPAIADAEVVAESPQATARQVYLAGCVYAVSVPADEAQTEAYGQRAVQLLRQAFDKGYEDPARIKTDPELNALRARADFQQLLAEVGQTPAESAPEGDLGEHSSSP
jgi:serine/threonine protein kinase